jgi:hypothetical protein
MHTDGQAMVEAAIAIPIAVLLFAGCVQLLQIGIAHIVVMDAAYEAGRQAFLDQGAMDRATQVAGEICRAVSPGATELKFENGQFIVTHHLQTLFPVLKNLGVSHSCPAYVFRADGGS